jgi:hypothetical protein
VRPSEHFRLCCANYRRARCESFLSRSLEDPPTESAQSAIQAIDNLEKLEQLTERLLTASSWQELLRDV